MAGKKEKGYSSINCDNIYSISTLVCLISVLFEWNSSRIPVDSCGFHWNSSGMTGFLQDSTGIPVEWPDSCRNRWGTVKYCCQGTSRKWPCLVEVQMHVGLNGQPKCHSVLIVGWLRLVVTLVNAWWSVRGHTIGENMHQDMRLSGGYLLLPWCFLCLPGCVFKRGYTP